MPSDEHNTCRGTHFHDKISTSMAIVVIGVIPFCGAQLMYATPRICTMSSPHIYSADLKSERVRDASVYLQRFFSTDREITIAHVSDAVTQ